MNQSPHEHVQPAAMWLMRVLALGAGGISAYLLWVSLSTAGLPAGCGAGSGCANVLSSRWGGTWGMPVSAPALLGYVAALIASWWIAPGQSESRQRLGWIALTVLAMLIAAAATWFILLQLFVIHAICPWCMADHAMGLALALVTLWQSRIRVSATRMTRCALATVVLLVGLIAGQVLVKYQSARLQRLPAGQNADSGPGADRTLQVLNGQLQLSPRAEPAIGSPDAPHLLVILFDYCCPHCQATHGYLMEAMSRFDGQMALIALPMPMDGKCNPNVKETESRFEHACKLARLALAVWIAKPQAFAEFDSWLFASDMPRSPDEATNKAIEMVGSALLEKAKADPSINQIIARDVEAYRLSGAARIPVILSPEMDTIVGEPDDAAALFKLLEDGLHVQAKHP